MAARRRVSLESWRGAPDVCRTFQCPACGQGGKTKLLALSNAKRSVALPDLPTG